jgi:hypothetical protein
MHIAKGASCVSGSYYSCRLSGSVGISARTAHKIAISEPTGAFEALITLSFKHADRFLRHEVKRQYQGHPEADRLR